MKTLQSILTSMALVVGLGLAPALMPAPAFAVDNMESTDAPDLSSVRAKIKAHDYAAALTELRDLAACGIRLDNRTIYSWLRKFFCDPPRIPEWSNFYRSTF